MSEKNPQQHKNMQLESKKVKENDQCKLEEEGESIDESGIIHLMII